MSNTAACIHKSIAKKNKNKEKFIEKKK